MTADNCTSNRGGPLKESNTAGGGQIKTGSLRLPSTDGSEGTQLRPSRSGFLTASENDRGSAELSSELRDKVGENAELKLRMAVLETARKRLNAEVDAQRKEKAAQIARLLESEGREHALQEELSKARENLARTTDELSEQKALIAQLQMLLSTQRTDAEEQAARILKAEANHQQLMVEVEVWRRDRRELSSQYVESEASRKRLQSIAEAHRKEKEDLVARLAKVENTWQQTLADLESQKLERHEHTAQFAESESVRKKLCATIEAQRKDKEQLRSELAKVESSRKSVQDQLEKQRKEKAKQSVRLAEVEHARQRLQKYIEAQEKKREEHVARIAEVEATLQAFNAEGHAHCQHCSERADDPDRDDLEHRSEPCAHVASASLFKEEDIPHRLDGVASSCAFKGDELVGLQGEVSCGTLLRSLLSHLRNLVKAETCNHAVAEECNCRKGRPELTHVGTSTDISESLQTCTERNVVQEEEKGDQISRIAELEAVVTDLRWQLEAWRQPPRHRARLAPSPALRNELPDRSLRCAVEAVLHEACSASRCASMATAKVLHVRPIINDILWQNYQNSRESMRVQHMRTLSRIPEIILPEIPKVAQEHFPWFAQSMDSSLNERLVFHGTTPDFVEQIAQRGFDERLAHLTGLFGAGVYFAEQSCKAFRYSGHGPVRCILLTRVLLGNPFFATGPMRSIRRPPLLDDNDPQQGLYDSIVAEVGTPTGKLHAEMEHRVFVLFEGKQAYPEMAVYFEVGT